MRDEGCHFAGRRIGWLAGLIIALAISPGAGAAEPAPVEVAQGLAKAALADPAATFDVVASLTTEVGQRLAGTPALAKAEIWAEARMKALGFQNVHAESFVLPVWTRGTETATVTGAVPQSLALTALGGSVATPAEGIDAEVAVFPTYAALLAVPPGGLAGKIAIVTQHMVRAQDGGGYGAANAIRRAGPSEAARRGAVAYLLRSLGTDSHRLPHTGALNYIEGVPQIPAAALSVPDAEQLDRLSALGPVKLHLVLTPAVRPDGQSWNVVGEIKGRERPEEVVLIGAHLDSWDLGTGATDDGAGIAIVAAAGRLIAALPQHPRRTLRIVFFGAEEMDYSGPAYAKAHAEEAGHVVLAAEADFGARPVYAVQLPPGTLGTPFAQSLGTVLAPVGAFLDFRPALRGGDDVEGLRRAGVPVASLRQDGSDYFDTHHTADDTLDKIDPPQLARAAAAWAAFAYLAAESDIDFRALAAAAPR